MLSIFIPRPNVWEIISSRQTKTSDIWLGSIESIIALAYKRFRPGAKLKISNFRITNDHSHNVRILKYNFDLQSVKRTMCGGKAVDMYNMKHPIYFAQGVLRLLSEEDRKLLLNLAIQGIENLLSETYMKDEIAKECLHQIKLILEILNYEPKPRVSSIDLSNNQNLIAENCQSIEETRDGYISKKLEEYRPTLRIMNNYLENPLTKYNQQVWSDKVFELQRICNFLRLASQHTALGKEPEEHLNEIKKILEPINEKMYEYYRKIIEGR
jgi:hypothetical protein